MGRIDKLCGAASVSLGRTFTRPLLESPPPLGMRVSSLRSRLLSVLGCIQPGTSSLPRTHIRRTSESLTQPSLLSKYSITDESGPTV